MPLIGHWPLQEQEGHSTSYTVRSGSPNILPFQSRIENLRSTESGTDNFVEFTFNSTQTRDFEFRYELANYTNGGNDASEASDRYHGIVEFFDSDGNVMFAVSVYAQDFHIWDTQSTNYDYGTIRDNSYDTEISPSGESHNIKITWDGSAWKVDIDNGAYTRTMTAMNSPVKRIWTGSEGSSDSYMNGTHEFNLEDLNQVLFDIAYDVAGNNNGKSKGATQGANGILGTNAYNFVRGNSDNINVPNISFDIPNESFSVSAWFQPNFDSTDGNDYTVVSWHESGNNNWRFRWEGGNSRWNYGWTNTNSGPNQNHNSGVWYHFTMTVTKGSNLTGYWNGEIVVERSSVDSASATADIGIGYFAAGNNRYFDGKIADVRIYDHALTPAEVQYLYEVSRRGRFVSSKWRK